MLDQNVPIEIWNIGTHRHRTNSAVESWISKLNSVTGQKQPNVFLQVQKVKDEAELVSWQLKSVEPGQPGQERRKTCIKKIGEY